MGKLSHGASGRVTAPVRRGGDLMFGFLLFTLKFVGLSLVYALIAWIVIRALERHHHHELGEYLGELRIWGYVLFGAFTITLLVAAFNWGPAVLLPEHFPSPEQRGDLSHFFNHLWEGKNAPAEKVPTDSLPWATGTWFWWQAAGIYFLLLLVVFWEELLAVLHRLFELIQERHDEALAERKAAHALAVAETNQRNAAGRGKKGHVDVPPPPPPPSRLSFWQFARWDLLIELVIEGARAFFRQHRQGA